MGAAVYTHLAFVHTYSEFNIAMDKRNVYDWNTRIHLLARGPGIKPGSMWIHPATQVDIAPTFLGLAGVAKPSQMDGKSLVPLLLAEDYVHELAPSTLAHLEALGAATKQGRQDYAAAWRDSVFIEYYYNDYNAKCRWPQPWPWLWRSGQYLHASCFRMCDAAINMQTTFVLTGKHARLSLCVRAWWNDGNV